MTPLSMRTKNKHASPDNLGIAAKQSIGPYMNMHVEPQLRKRLKAKLDLSHVEPFSVVTDQIMAAAIKEVGVITLTQRHLRDLRI